MRLDEAAAAKRGAHLASLASQALYSRLFLGSGGCMRGSVREARVYRV